MLIVKNRRRARESVVANNAECSRGRGGVRSAVGKVNSWLTRLAHGHAVRWTFGVSLTVRICVSALAILVITLRLLEEGWPERYLMSLGPTPVSGRAQQLLQEAWQRWDVLHDQGIALAGYSQYLDGWASTFHPPVYPLVMRLVGTLLEGNHRLAGMIVSSAACFLALFCLFRLTEQESNRFATRRTVLRLSIFPTTFFLIVPYAESLFLLSSLLVCHAACRDKWPLAGGISGLATLTRPQGAVSLVPLGVEYLRQRQSLSLSAWAGMTWLGLIPSSLVVFFVFLTPVNSLSTSGALAEKLDLTFVPP